MKRWFGRRRLAAAGLAVAWLIGAASGAAQNAPQDIKAQLAAIELGDILPAPIPPPPTQEELDRAAFLTLCQVYRQQRAEVVGGMGKATQADVDTTHAQMQATYKDTYAPLIVGVF